MTGTRFAVIGLGYFGTAIARILSDRGAEVMAIDNSHDRVEAIKDDVSYAVRIDATDKKSLSGLNLDALDAVVVAIGENFEGLLLCTFNLQELGVKRIITRASAPSQAKILRKMGLDEILQPEVEVGASVAESLLNPNVLTCLNLPDDYEIVEIKPPRQTANRTLADIGLRNKYKLNLVTVLREEETIKNGKTVREQHIIGVPSSETVILPTDTIVVFGKTKSIEKFIEIND
jgi:trk system potassium uptake protein TrkA